MTRHLALAETAIAAWQTDYIASRTASTPILIVTADVSSTAQRLRELTFYCAQHTKRMYAFPDWEILPYDAFSPHADIISQRLNALYHCKQSQVDIVITAISTLMTRCAPSHHVMAGSLNLSAKQHGVLSQLQQQLIDSGYDHVPQVRECGQMAVRGGLLDVFPMGSRSPLRIDFFDDELDSIRIFDPESQRSTGTLDQVNIHPAHEYPLDEKAITQFRNAWRDSFTHNPTQSPIYQAVSEGKSCPGLENYLPLFYEHMATLLDYLPADTPIILEPQALEHAQQFWTHINDRHEQKSHDITHPLLPPEQLYISPKHLLDALENREHIKLKSPQKMPRAATYQRLTLPTQQDSDDAPIARQLHQASKQATSVLITAENDGRLALLKDKLNQCEIYPKTCGTWQDFKQSKPALALCKGPLLAGYVNTEMATAVITADDLLGTRGTQQQTVKQSTRFTSRLNIDPNTHITQLAALKPGEPVVHIDHGIGRYQGLTTMTHQGVTEEFVVLTYADEDKLYLPISNLDAISRYTSGDEDLPAPITRLGGDQWQNTKRKALQRIHDTAAELLAIAAKREHTPAHAYCINEQDFGKFCEEFPFDETPDQSRVSAEVALDMSQPKAMDRLLCADVGFGKTEIAMRAAFLAVQDGRQVAVLTPTTLLAHQHFLSFEERFAGWPIRVEELSGLRTAKEQKAVLEGLANQQVDVVIGTHKLLQKTVTFKQLGLLVVDEEHRFGVRHKEQIKSLRAEVDILTLTATPIPRTLHQSLSSLRDLSLMITPPAKRLAVQTFVHEYNMGVIKEAMARELQRGGQVFYLYNRVDNMEQKREMLAQLMPDASISVAHGQMAQGQLERVMQDFYHQKANVLLCTTIIESGIDVPTANTIIVERADKFGLAQLHQIRGRVGRSHHQAYAYLLIPERELLTKDALSRLDAIAHYTTLGAGFQLARHDLEIRGAGELLGKQQSGHMQAIGFDLYTQLLQRAVNTLKKGGKLADVMELNAHTLEIDCHSNALLPDQYISDVHLRLVLYKRIANCEHKKDLISIAEELEDRFGTRPPEVEQLLRCAVLRIKAREANLTHIDATETSATLKFDPSSLTINPKLIQAVQTQPNCYQIKPPNRIILHYPETPGIDRPRLIEQFIDAFLFTPCAKK